MKYFILSIVMTGCTLAILIAIKSYKPQPAQCPVHTQYDAILECQKLFAVTTRKDFSYTSCIKELKETIEAGRMLRI